MTVTESSGHEVASFVDDLLGEMRAKSVSILDGEFLRAVEEMTVTREQILAWAKPFYAVTKNGRLVLGTYYANSPDEPELRRELAENIYEEETGRISGVNKCHMDVFFDFLAAFGVSEEGALAEPSPMGDQPPQGRVISPEDFYVELATYGMCIETPNAEWSARMDKALRENYGFTPEQTRWFSMHAELDADHGEEFRAYALKAADTPDGLQRVREATLAMSPMIRDIWDGCGLWKNV